MASQGSQGREQFVNRRYRVVRQLGAGGMGTVYLVEDSLDENQLLALKTLRTGATSAYSYNAFRNEFQAMTQLRHPNVVEVYEFGTLGPHEDFFTMEVVDGHNLLDATEHAPLETICDYAIQTARALEYIHSQGFIHFDLKPDNIMVRRDGTVKVMDFGLVEDMARIQTGTVKGSVHYIAPEMVRGGAMDHRFDLYGLGAVLFHIIARRPLFEGPIAEVMHHHVHTAPDFERDVKRPFPPELRRLFERMLAKTAAERPASASEVLGELGRIVGSAGGAVVREGRKEAESYVLGSRFVGRERELAQLKEAFERRVEQSDSKGSQGHAGPPLMLLTGPAGIGRSRLAQELRHYVQLHGVRFAHGSSLEDGGQPYLPFAEIIRALVREILPSEGAVELSTFRDARSFAYVTGTNATSAANPTATLKPTDSDAMLAAAGNHGDTLDLLAGPVEGPTLSATVARTMVVTAEARGPREDSSEDATEHSTALGVIYSAKSPDPRPVNDEQANELREQTHAAVAAVLAAHATAIARLLPDHRALVEMGGVPPAFHSPKAESEWLIESTARFLIEAARVRPLVLYLSDLQWADELTIDLLLRLGRELSVNKESEDGKAPPRFLLLACYRSDEVAGTPLEKAVSALGDERISRVLALDPMGPGELGRVLHSMLGPVSLSPRGSQKLLERTGGNPFLIEAMVRGLLDHGALQRVGSTFELSDDAVEDAAHSAYSIEQVLDAAIGRLGPGELDVLQLLTVFNRPTSALVLQRAGLGLEELPRLLALLQKKRFLQRGWADGSYQYRVRHNQLRAHVYRGLDIEKLARLHEAAGRALESRYGASERYLEDLAQHFHRAGNSAKTLHYARAAADNARHLYDLKRAASLYLTAWEALGRLPTPTSNSIDRRREEAELAVAIAEVSYYSPSEANAVRLQRAAAIAEELADGTLANRIQNALGRTFYALGKQREAIRCFQDFMKGTAGTADDFTRAMPFCVLGRVYFFMGQLRPASEYLGRGITLLRTVAGSEEDVSYALGMRGSALAFQGELARGLEWIDESIAIARRIHHQTRLALGLIYRGICLAHHGRWDEARGPLDEGLALCARTGDVIGTGTGSSFRGQIALAEGNAAEAARLSRHGRDAIARAGGTWTFTMIGTHLADALLAGGDVEGALAAAEETLKVVETGERWGESCLHLALGRIHHARRDHARAESEFEKAAATAMMQEARPFEARARLALGHFLATTDRPAEGRVEIEAAREAFKLLGMGWYQERAERLLRGAALGPCP